MVGYQAKGNSRYWCEYCRIYIYDNKICRSKHDNSPEHKTAQAKYLERLQREEGEQTRTMKDFQLRTGINLDAAAVGVNKVNVKSNSSFYGTSSSSSGIIGKKVTAQPVHLLSMKGGIAKPTIKKSPKVIGFVPESLAIENTTQKPVITQWPKPIEESQQVVNGDEQTEAQVKVESHLETELDQEIQREFEPLTDLFLEEKTEPDATNNRILDSTKKVPIQTPTIILRKFNKPTNLRK